MYVILHTNIYVCVCVRAFNAHFEKTKLLFIYLFIFCTLLFDLFLIQNFYATPQNFNKNKWMDVFLFVILLWIK